MRDRRRADGVERLSRRCTGGLSSRHRRRAAHKAHALRRHASKIGTGPRESRALHLHAREIGRRHRAVVIDQAVVIEVRVELSGSGRGGRDSRWDVGGRGVGVQALAPPDILWIGMSGERERRGEAETCLLELARILEATGGHDQNQTAHSNTHFIAHNFLGECVNALHHQLGGTHSIPSRLNSQETLCRHFSECNRMGGTASRSPAPAQSRRYLSKSEAALVYWRVRTLVTLPDLRQSNRTQTTVAVTTRFANVLDESCLRAALAHVRWRLKMSQHSCV